MLEYQKHLATFSHSNIELILFPSQIYLPLFLNVPYKIGSQNLSKYASGSFTGEVLASQLATLNVSYTLINHAEVNDYPTDIILKIQNATKANIKVVLCIGEQTKQPLETTLKDLIIQINSYFLKLSLKERQNIIIAYEPIWTIGKTNSLDKDTLNTIVTNLKEYLNQEYHLNPPIIYGGGLNPTNIVNFTKIDNIDGYLLGNSANNLENLDKIIEKL